jgi:N6-L-threonylcarbamoyladenine synthase
MNNTKKQKISCFSINQNNLMNINILGIESSCDDTSAAVVQNTYLQSNVIANQDVHKTFGGVVPELASRAHQQNIIPVVDRALKLANLSKKEINAIAFTRGPGLMGSLLVGASFAKGLSLSLGIPLIEVNHLQAHILANFIMEKNAANRVPKFPFICLLVSGGHTQLVLVKDYLNMRIIGQTIDDAAGEAFDKCAKILGLPYPGGPVIDKLAMDGNPEAFKFAKPKINNYDYSFSGVKTSFLYFLRDQLHQSPSFLNTRQNDLCASIQKTIIDILIEKLIKASKDLKIKEIALAGGVAANSGLRTAITAEAEKHNWNVYFPAFKFTTDNAAMIAITGFYKFQKKEFASQDIVPAARIS